jgi:hypothetical protein
MSAHAVHAAPPALASTITLLSVAQGAATSASTFALTKGTLKFMLWSKTQTATVGLVVTGLATVSVLQHQAQARLRQQNQALVQQVGTLQSDNDRLSNLVAQADSGSVLQAVPSDELLRLRGEVGLLRRQTNELQMLLSKRAETQGPRSLGQPAQPAGPPPQQLSVPELIATMTQNGSPDFAELNELIRRGQDAVPDLVAELERSDSWLVPKALGGIKDPRTVDPLIAALEKRPSWPYGAVTVEALEYVTGQKAGTNAQAWTAWRQTNRP